jgi:hypothetical protein
MKMQVTQATTTSALLSGSTDASDVTAQKIVPTEVPAPADSDAANAGNSSAYTVSLSSAALAYVSPSNTQSSALLEQLGNAGTALRHATHKDEPKKLKSLLEHMLEWSAKYEEQRRARAKNDSKSSNSSSSNTSGNGSNSGNNTSGSSN